MSDVTALHRHRHAGTRAGRAQEEGRQPPRPRRASSSRRRSWCCSSRCSSRRSLYALYLSLFREQLVGGNTFVGLDNYTDGLKDEAVHRRRQARGAVPGRPGAGDAGPGAHVRAHHRLGQGAVRKLFRVGFFVPYAVPTVIAALMWGFLYGRDFGPFADIADALGVAPPNFLGESTMLWSIANVSTWTYTGYNMIIFYAALRAIPAELYEAAAVDGAGRGPHGDPHQAAAAAPGDPAVRDLLGDRLVPAVRRAADLLRHRARRSSARPTRRTSTSTTSRSPTSGSTTRPRCRSCSGSSCSSCRTLVMYASRRQEARG